MARGQGKGLHGMSALSQPLDEGLLKCRVIWSDWVWLGIRGKGVVGWWMDTGGIGLVDEERKVEFTFGELDMSPWS